MNAGDICPDCELIGLPGALCPKHAATDELLAACKLAYRAWTEKPPIGVSFAELLTTIRAAIDKAEGRS